MYEIDFYEDRNGDCELRNFLETLNQSHRKEDMVLLRKITFQLELLAQLGPKLREPHAKFLKGYQYPLMELRPMPNGSSMRVGTTIDSSYYHIILNGKTKQIRVKY